MASLKHDAQGFLTGDPIDLTRALKDWDGIRDDVRAIRNVVLGLGAKTLGTRQIQPGTPSPRTHSGGATRKSEPAAPRGTSRAQALAGEGAARRVPQAATPTPRAAGASKVATASPSPAAVGAALREAKKSANRAPALPAVRDGRGRFVARDGAVPDGAGHDGAGEGGALRALADRMVSAIKGSGDGLGEVDPTVKAFNEVAQPMARGYAMLTGGSEDKKQVGLLRRIYASMTGLRKEESVFNRAANKSLHNIEGNGSTQSNGGEGAGGFLGLVSGLFPRLISALGSIIPFLGTLFTRFLAPIAGVFAAWNVGQWIGTKLYEWLDKSGINTIIFDAFDSAKEAISSGWDQVVSAWDATLSMISSAWDGVVSGFNSVSENISKGWDSVKSGFDGLVRGMGAAWDAVTGFLKEKFNIDIPGILKPFVDGGKKVATSVSEKVVAAKDAVSSGAQTVKQVATDAVGKAGDFVSSKASSANSFIKDKTGVDIKASAGSVKDRVVEGAKSAGDWVLGQTSKMFESGKGGAATVSSGKGDFGGASYGTYQLSSKQGEVQKFLKTSKYGDQFSGLQPGTPEFDAKWKDVAKADPEFGGAQHDYIKATKFDPAMAGLKGAGIDLSGRGAAVQDAIWSSSVQFGAGDKKKGNGAVGMFQKALSGKDIAAMSDKDIVTAVQDYKIANNDKLFASSSENVRAGTAKRAQKEKENLIALDNKGNPVQVQTPVTTPAAPVVSQATAPVTAQAPAPPKAPSITAQVAPVVAGVSIPSVPTAPVVPPVAEAPQIVAPLASNSVRPQAVTTAAKSDVGQDLRERGIAHIVTGGLSGG